MKTKETDIIALDDTGSTVSKFYRDNECTDGHCVILSKQLISDLYDDKLLLTHNNKYLNYIIYLCIIG